MKSLFTKVFTTGFIATSAMVGFGQVNVTDNTSKVFGEELEATVSLEEFSRETMKKHGKLEVTEWYSYIGALTENGEAYTYFTGTSMMPDSNAVQIFRDENDNPYTDHVGLFSTGQVFSPMSEHFVLIPETPPLSRFNAYTVDSIQFFYKYRNENPGVTDTILVQFFNNDDVSGLNWTSDQSPTAAPTYTPALNRSEDATNEIKIPISESTPNFYSREIGSFSGVAALPTGLGQTDGGELTAYTISFIPGMSYSFGDTIVNDSLVTGDTKINAFMPLIVRQGTVNNPAFLADTTMNHGVFAFSNQRYNSQTQWYFPYNPPGTLARQHVYSIFHLSSPNVSAPTLALDGYKLGQAYPNPATTNSVVTVPFGIGQAHDVSIEVFNLVGNKVAEHTAAYGAGEHNASISTNNLNAGIYLYTITAGDYQATAKFTVK